MTALESGIDWGTQVDNTSLLGPNVISYWFEVGGQKNFDTAIGPVTTVSLASYESRFAAAFAVYASFLNVTFVEAGSESSADFKLAGYADINDSTLGAMEPPGEPNEGVGVFNTEGFGWTTASLAQGGYGFVTIIHELGHGMGLAHPHDNGGTPPSTVFPGVGGEFDTGTYDLNQGVYTTMSYIDGWRKDPDGLPPDGGSYGFQGMPMAIDIAVLQAKYGANLNYHTGDNVYLLPGSNGTGTFFSCIWDAGGTDQIDYSGSRSVTIELRAATLKVAPGGGGFISYAHGVFGGFTIAHGVSIENASSGFGNDFIAGNSLANVIDGGGGNDRLVGGGRGDTLYGRAGADFLNGGPGSDRLVGGGAADAFLFSSAFAPSNVDTIVDFRHGLDEIDLARSVFAGLAHGVLPASAFFRGGAAHDLSDRIIYNPGNGALIYDGNGSHAGAGHLFANLAAGLAINAGDFLVL